MFPRRTILAALAAAALSVHALSGSLAPVQAGNAASRAVRFEPTSMGSELKFKGRGSIAAKDASNMEKGRIEVETAVLSGGAQLHVYAIFPDSTVRPELLGVIDLVKDPAEPGLARGYLEWKLKSTTQTQEIRVTNNCDSTFVYLVGR